MPLSVEESRKLYARSNPKRNDNGRSRPVYAVDKDGNRTLFPSITEAHRAGWVKNAAAAFRCANKVTKVGCDGLPHLTNRQHNGYQWQFADDPEPLPPYPSGPARHPSGAQHYSSRGVIGTKEDGTEVRYGSTREAMRLTGIHYTGIIFACKGAYAQAGGMKWRWADEQK